MTGLDLGFFSPLSGNTGRAPLHNIINWIMRLLPSQLSVAMTTTQRLRTWWGRPGRSRTKAG